MVSYVRTLSLCQSNYNGGMLMSANGVQFTLCLGNSGPTTGCDDWLEILDGSSQFLINRVKPN